MLSYPDEEVDHEEDVEGEVDLLGRVLCPGDALLYTLTTHTHVIDQLRYRGASLERDFHIGSGL